MKPILVGGMVLLSLCLALPALGSPLFSGTDSADHDVISARPYAIRGTNALVMLIQSRYAKTRDYVVMLRSMAASTNKKLIAELRFHDGDEEKEPYAVWMDSCFVHDGTLCNGNPGLKEPMRLSELLNKINTIIRNHPMS